MSEQLTAAERAAAIFEAFLKHPNQSVLPMIERAIADAEAAAVAREWNRLLFELVAVRESWIADAKDKAKSGDYSAAVRSQHRAAGADECLTLIGDKLIRARTPAPATEGRDAADAKSRREKYSHYRETREKLAASEVRIRDLEQENATLRGERRVSEPNIFASIRRTTEVLKTATLADVRWLIAEIDRLTAPATI